jgi:hypothetical protein
MAKLASLRKSLTDGEMEREDEDRSSARESSSRAEGDFEIR